MNNTEHSNREWRWDQPARLVWSRRRLLQRTAALGTVALGALLCSTACQGLSHTARALALVDQAPEPTLASTVTAPAAITPTVPSQIVASPTSVNIPTPSITPSGAATPATSSTKPPNVLLVTIDTLRADRIGAYGFGPAFTPTLDRVAREGVRFDRAVCQLPQTDPSHAAMLTGLYASTSGLKVHMKDVLGPGTQTAATIFQSAGYQTAGFYSWLSLDNQYCGLGQGFQTYEGYVINVDNPANQPNVPRPDDYLGLKSEFSVAQTADITIASYVDYDRAFDGRSDVTNQAVFAWLDAHANQGPFFLWVHYFDPHFPYTPPVGYDHLWGLDYQGSIDGAYSTIWDIFQSNLQPTPADVARIEELYQGEIAFADAQLGRLLDRLALLGVKDTTIVTVTGDHGESFGEHGDWIHGLKVYETEIRVPLLMRYPARLPAGTTVTAPAQHIDILPTLLELTGLTAKQTIQGTSLLPVMSPDTDATSRVAFTELANEAFVSVLSWGDWKIIRNNANDQIQLYNLNLDEAEQTNLASDQLGITAELHARLLDQMKISGVSHS